MIDDRAFAYHEALLDDDFYDHQGGAEAGRKVESREAATRIAREHGIEISAEAMRSGARGKKRGRQAPTDKAIAKYAPSRISVEGGSLRERLQAAQELVAELTAELAARAARGEL